MSACGSSKRKRKGTVPHKNWKGSDSLERVTNKTAVTIEEESGEAGEKGVEFTRTDVKHTCLHSLHVKCIYKDFSEYAH